MVALSLSRRRFVIATGAGLAAGPGELALPRRPLAADPLTVVEWGGPWLDATKSVLGRDNRFQINWVLHAGASAAIITKIKASLPKWNYDVVHAFPPVTYAMMQEGWLEPLTFEDVPNLRDVPDNFLMRDSSGAIINCPTSHIAAFWGYRTDLVKKPIVRSEDLLDPSLKGKILFLSPALQSGRLLLSLALERGGDERNIDPGFAFAKELARSGNVGRVANSDVEVLNSITSGETAVAFTSLATWHKIAQSQPVKYVVKNPDSSTMFRLYASQEEWSILKGSSNKAAAKEFINWFISPEVHEKYCSIMGILPINRKSKAPAELSFLNVESDADRKRYQYFPDYPYISQQLKSWTERWEKEVAPLF